MSYFSLKKIINYLSIKNMKLILRPMSVLKQIANVILHKENKSYFIAKKKFKKKRNYI